MARRRRFLLVAVCGLIVGACSVGPGSALGSLSPEPSTKPGATMFGQPWATATLTDVTTGAQFRIADLAAQGKVVLVETMATWCPNCLSQQRDLVTAFAQGLDPARVELVELDVDPSESATELANYRTQNGFDFRYAVAGSDVSRALADEFGDVVLNPSSVNLIILGTDGTVTHTTGHHGPADLIMLASQHGA
jgi:thiol-disulfide isomerase/thioredoxin